LPVISTFSLHLFLVGYFLLLKIDGRLSGAGGDYSICGRPSFFWGDFAQNRPESPKKAPLSPFVLTNMTGNSNVFKRLEPMIEGTSGSLKTT
jgi:hypothetical protein